MSRRPITVEALAQLAGVSRVTIRRDLADLEGEGLLRRVHGGAVAVGLRGTPLPYALRAAENADAKAAIADRVAQLVEDDMAIVLDNGSTMVAIADALATRPLTAMCITLRSAMALSQSSGTTVVTPGGTVVHGSLRYGGAACLEALNGFSADLAIIGTCSATAAGGLTVTTSEDARVKRAIIAASARTVLAATGDKLARSSSFRFASLSDVDDLVTTRDAPAGVLEEFRLQSVRVHLAD